MLFIGTDIRKEVTRMIVDSFFQCLRIIPLYKQIIRIITIYILIELFSDYNRCARTCIVIGINFSDDFQFLFYRQKSFGKEGHFYSIALFISVFSHERFVKNYLAFTNIFGYAFERIKLIKTAFLPAVNYKLSVF